MLNYAGKKLRGRPFKSNSDLKGDEDFSGWDLRGVNFSELDLSGVSFADADIRGANFTNATLRNTNFTGVRAGLQKRWRIMQFAAALVLSTMTHLMLAMSNESLVKILFNGSNILVPDIFITLPTSIFILLSMQGVISRSAGGIAIATAIAIAVKIIVTSAASTVFVFTLTFSVLTAIGWLLIYVSWQLSERKSVLIHAVGVAFSSWGGTSFCGADLSSASFVKASLKSANFNTSKLQSTRLHHVDWTEALHLDRSRISGSILTDPVVRELLITQRGHSKNYFKVNLSGANLMGVDLNYANLKRADLSNALLHQAQLKEANLREAIVLGADFSGAYLTGACIEAWNMDTMAVLRNVDCQYVFLLEEANRLGSRERRPHDPDKIFNNGDFEKLYCKIMDTVQILLRDGIHPEALSATFQKLNVEYPDFTFKSIQAIERKENDVLLSLQTPANTDKGKFENQFYENYTLKLEAQKSVELLAAEQRHNQDLKEITLTQTENLGRFLSNFTIINGNQNTMTNQNPNIEAGDGSFINTGDQILSNSLINLSGTVTNALNSLADSDPVQANLKTALTQLQSVIETEPEIDDDDKAYALEQVNTLARAGQNSQKETSKMKANTAIGILKKTIAVLPSTAAIVKACSDLLPVIAKLLGL
jgi:uncharacterized protein YjbI with pentapeptide repeats